MPDVALSLGHPLTFVFGFASASSLAGPLPPRFSQDPAGLAALGYVLLSTSNSGSSGSNRHGVGNPEGLEKLGRAIAAFRGAINVSQANSPFVPATRGLAVALRRRRLMIGCATQEGRTPLRGPGDATSNNSDGENRQVGRVWCED